MGVQAGSPNGESNWGVSQVGNAIGDPIANCMQITSLCLSPEGVHVSRSVSVYCFNSPALLSTSPTSLYQFVTAFFISSRKVSLKMVFWWFEEPLQCIDLLQAIDIGMQTYQ